MNKGLNIFLIVSGLFFFCPKNYAQQGAQNISAVHVSSLYLLSFPGTGSSYAPLPGKHVSLFTGKAPVVTIPSYPTLSVAKDMSVSNMAFFCRQEWKMEKTIKIPIRFRMGSLAQCNALEGK